MGSNNHLRGTSIRGAPHEWRRQFHRGWVDAQNGTRWPDDYEHMSRSEQIAYEQGRLLLREAMIVGCAIPVWRGDKAGCAPVEKLWGDVHAMGARVVPPEFEQEAV